MTGDPARKSDRRPLRVMFTGGGTGGHVYPGLAVAEKLLELAPGIEVRFVGTRKGLESVLVPQAGYRFSTVPASGVRGLGGKARALFLLNFVFGFLRSLGLMVGRRPDVVLGTGGYVTGPVMAAARVLGVRCVLQEQNAIPGSANRLAARWAERIYLGFAAAGDHFPAGKSVTTGNPVRSEFLRSAGTVKLPAGFSAADDGSQRILVFGGSGGARTLNRALAGGADRWLADPRRRLLIQTGLVERDRVAEAFSAAASDRVQVVPYIQEMAGALAWADLVICRAGAMTLAELQASGKAAVLVPFPHATDNHQLRNAEDCARAGAAVVIEDAECTPEVLLARAGQLLADPRRLLSMGEAARSLGRPDAAGHIARDLLSRLDASFAQNPEGEAPVVP